MKKVRSIIIIITGCIILSACSAKKDQDKGHQHNQMSETIQDESHNQVDVDSGKPGSVVDRYLSLKDALVHSDAVLAQKESEKLSAALMHLNHHNEAEMANALAKEDKLDEQRKMFQKLSEKIYDLAASKSIAFNTLYKQYCPMAFDNTGAFWLSDSKSIRNPYFGDKMLKCGRIAETLATK